MGTKRNVLTDEKGLPLSVVLPGANTHDIKLLGATFNQIMIQHPKSSAKFTQNLCLDAGYTGSKDKVERRGYIAHIHPRSEEKQELLRNPDSKARRWVIKVTYSLFNRLRKLLVRFEKKATNHLGLLHFACAIIVRRKLIRVHIQFMDRLLVLARLGYRPVPLYNGVYGIRVSSMIVPVEDIVAALYKGADILRV